MMMAAKSPPEDEISYEMAHTSSQSPPPPGILRRPAYDTPLYVNEDHGPGPDDYMSDTEDEGEEDGGRRVDEDGHSISNRSATSDDEDLPFPGLNEKVFYCLGQLSIPRLWCIQLVCWPWFERISMAIILLNCVTLGMYQPCNDDVCDDTRCIILHGLDHFIFAFFALEMLVKMLAMGVTGKLGYLGETWNRLDFFIVIAGVVEYSIDMESMNLNLSAIRTIRVLRPLRAINRIPSLRILVMLLLDTLPMLGNVLMLCFFVFFIFGIIGVQLWSGKLRQRCFLDLPGEAVFTGYSQIPNLTDFYEDEDPYTDFVCSLDSDNGMRKCNSELKADAKPRYQEDGQDCYGNLTHPNDCINWNQYYTVCNFSDKNPFLGSISFDNILYAWIAIFQVISLEGWTEIQYYLQDSHSDWTWMYFLALIIVITLEGWTDIMYHVQDAHTFWIWEYFVVLIIIGAFFLINLCLVVIATQFSETKQRENQLIAEQRRRFKSSSTLTSNSEMGSCYDEILKYLGHLGRKAKRRFRRWRKRMQSKRQGKVMPALTLRKRKKTVSKIPKQTETHHYRLGNGSPRVGRASEQDASGPGNHGAKTPGSVLVPSHESLHSISYCTEHLSKLSPADRRCVHSKSSPTTTHGGGGHANCTMSIHRASSINYPPTTNSKDSQGACLLARYNVESGVGSGKLPDRWKELCTENHERPLSVADDSALEGALVPSHPPLAQRLSAPPLTSPYPILPSTPTHSIHPGCPVHTPCPIHTPCPTHAPCLVHRPSCLKQGDGDDDDDASGESSSSGEEGEEDSSVCDSDVEHKAGFRIRRRPLGLCHWIRLKTRQIVESKYFMRFILASILVNTLSMGIEFHGQPQELTEAIEVSNLIFSSIFALEMAMKLTAYGIFGYIKNGFNVFDGIIVIVSIMEVMQQGSGGLSVLRTFRLLRILKLVRFMPALRRQLLVMLRTMDNVATFFSLLALFIFIFSVLGMHLFGCQFCHEIDGEKVCDRKNFDSLLWAIVTVFQILTQEDWNIVLYNGMSETSPWAALYFIALMTFGNYVLFNLLVAILVEGFSAEDDRQKEANLQQNTSKEQLDGTNGYPLEGKGEAEVDGLSAESTQAGRQLLPPPTGQLRSPPVITHTAATPQGSPNVSTSRLERPPYKEGYMDSDSHSMSSLGIRNTPNLSRSGSARSTPQRRVTAREANHLTPYVVANGNDRHSTSSDSRASIPSSVSNGHIRENESNGGSESRRTSYISCNGGSMILQQPPKGDPALVTPVTLDLTDGSSSTFTGDEGVEDPDAIDEAFHHPRHTTPPPAPSSQHAPDDQMIPRSYQVYLEKGATDELCRNGCQCCMDCNFTKCCPEPKGCFKTRLEWSLYLLSPRNKFRRSIQRLLAHKWFDYTILIIIFANCITLAMETPKIEDGSWERLFLTICNYIFTLIFSVEMGIKVIAKGFVFGKHAYINSGWNIMDGFLVFVSWIDLIITFFTSASPEIFGILRVFRLLRTLRPLRVISRAPGLKLVVQTLLSSLRPIGNIVIICCTFFIIFGILGIQLFKGKFYYCDGINTKLIKNMTQCKANQGNWVNQQYNFDNLGQALMALFVLASKDGWVDIMYNGIDAVDIDQQPQRDYNEFLILYFISFLLIVGFFVLNMFVGVVVENFHKCREQQAAEEMAHRLEKRRKKIELARQRALEQPYFENFSKYRMKIHNMVMHKYFDLIVALIIFLNVITMALEHYQMPLLMEEIMGYFNYVFTVVFIIEAILKIIALSFRRYIRDRWNKLDMFIVILSIVSIVLEEMEADSFIPVNPTIVRTMRVLRIARVLKLLKMASGVRALLDTIMKALPQVGNLGLLFFLLFFIFAALGVELFGRVACTEENPCEGLGRHAKFDDFFIAFLTLFRVATGDNWNGIMKDTLRQEHCDKSANCKTNCCANAILAPIFFVTFVLMAQFVLVNVVVAVLMKHLEESHKMADMDEEQEDLEALEDRFRQEASEAENRSDLDEEPGNASTPLLKKPAQVSDVELNVGEDVQSERSRDSFYRRPSISMANLADLADYVEDSFKPPVSRVKSMPANLAMDERDAESECHYTANEATPSPVRNPQVPTINLILPPDAGLPLRSERGTPVPPRKHPEQSPHRTLSAHRRTPSHTDSVSSGESFRTCEEDLKPSSSFRELHPGAGDSHDPTAAVEEVPLRSMNRESPINDRSRTPAFEGKSPPRESPKVGSRTPEPKRKSPPLSQGKSPSRGSPDKGSRSPESERISPPRSKSRSPKERRARTPPKAGAQRSSGPSPNSMRREENSRSRLIDRESSSGEEGSDPSPGIGDIEENGTGERLSVPTAAGSGSDLKERTSPCQSLISWDSDEESLASEQQSVHGGSGNTLGVLGAGGTEEGGTNARRRSPHQRRDLLQQEDNRTDSSQF